MKLPFVVITRARFEHLLEREERADAADKRAVAAALGREKKKTVDPRQLPLPDAEGTPGAQS